MASKTAHQRFKEIVDKIMSILRKIFGKKQPTADSDPVGYQKRIGEGQKKYGGYVKVPPKVKKLRKKGNNKKAVKLLLSAVDLVESESKYIGEKWGVAPWYYEQLAIIYREEKDYRSEVKILQRYSKQSKAPGAGPNKLAERLVKAKLLLKNNA